MAKRVDSDIISYVVAKIRLLISNLVIPTKTSDLTNDSGYITTSDIPPGAAASSAAPLMDGTAAAGSSNAFARGDHVHPSDTSKVDVSTYQTYVNNVDNTLGTIANNLAFAQGDIDTLSADVYRKSQVYTKTEIDNKLVGAMEYKGTKATVADLPASGNSTGDTWHVTADGAEYAWNGSAWEELGRAVDPLMTTAEVDALFV